MTDTLLVTGASGNLTADTPARTLSQSSATGRRPSKRRGLDQSSTISAHV
jgi:hypothetical protein